LPPNPPLAFDGPLQLAQENELVPTGGFRGSSASRRLRGVRGID